MALALLTTPVANVTVIRAADMIAEFNNIYNNALSLISPLTGDLAFGGNKATGISLGTAGSPSVQFTGDTNTGMYSSGADLLDFTIGGTRAAGFSGGRFLVGTTLTTGSFSGDVVVTNGGAFRFVNTGGTTSTNFGMMTNASNDIGLHVGAVTNAIGFNFAGNNRVYFKEENSGAGLVFVTESSADHAAPSTNQVVIYVKEDSGKTKLFARFATGAVQVIAAEP